MTILHALFITTVSSYVAVKSKCFLILFYCFALFALNAVIIMLLIAHASCRYVPLTYWINIFLFSKGELSSSMMLCVLASYFVRTCRNSRFYFCVCWVLELLQGISNYPCIEKWIFQLTHHHPVQGHSIFGPLNLPKVNDAILACGRGDVHVTPRYFFANLCMSSTCVI